MINTKKIEFLISSLEKQILKEKKEEISSSEYSFNPEDYFFTLKEQKQQINLLERKMAKKLIVDYIHRFESLGKHHKQMIKIYACLKKLNLNDSCCSIAEEIEKENGGSKNELIIFLLKKDYLIIQDRNLEILLNVIEKWDEDIVEQLIHSYAPFQFTESVDNVLTVLNILKMAAKRSDAKPFNALLNKYLDCLNMLDSQKRKTEDFFAVKKLLKLLIYNKERLKLILSDTLLTDRIVEMIQNRCYAYGFGTILTICLIGLCDKNGDQYKKLSNLLTIVEKQSAEDVLYIERRSLSQLLQQRAFLEFWGRMCSIMPYRKNSAFLS